MKKVLIFGGSGMVGRHLIRKLTKNNHLVTVVTRNLHTKGAILKLGGNPGYIDVIEANVFDENQLNNLFKDKDICINLVGILFENKKNSFKNIHTNFPDLLAKKSEEYNLNQFIHISALGIEKAVDSNYAISKLEGEKKIINNFPKSTILVLIREPVSYCESFYAQYLKGFAGKYKKIMNPDKWVKRFFSKSGNDYEKLYKIVNKLKSWKIKVIPFELSGFKLGFPIT